MAKVGGLIGLETVMSGLNHRLSKMKNQSEIGMKEAVIMIHEDMEKVPPKIPLDDGHLRNSWFAHFKKNAKGNPGAIFGFTANYAFFVHENINPIIKWSRPGSGPKFMQAAIKRNYTNILKVIGGAIQ